MINFKNYVLGKKAFIPFVTAGDPNLNTTKEILKSLVKAGSSIIEVGIPFSDPIAEGNTIMEADIRALASGTTVDKIFDMINDFRKDYKDFPLVFMTYLNPVFSYGYDKFFKKCKDANIKGIIIPDMPYEEKEEVRSVAKLYDVAVISLISPTSSTRIKTIASDAEGFLYLVSSLGVTGVRDKITTDINGMATEIKKYTDIPVCVGFGIKSSESALKMTEVADGAIIGSAIVNIIAKYKEESPKYVYDFAKEIVDALNK